MKYEAPPYGKTQLTQFFAGNMNYRSRPTKQQTCAIVLCSRGLIPRVTDCVYNCIKELQFIKVRKLILNFFIHHS